ncbi:MAG: SH3 domain-containing protein, partial [Pseudomonadota bacterium]
GPGLNYPKDWVFRRAGLPVKVIEEYGGWRRIVDSDDAGGWVYHALLTGRRTVLVVAPEVMLREKPAHTARATAMLMQGVTPRLRACDGAWCRLEIGDVAGWAPSATLWGVE